MELCAWCIRSAGVQMICSKIHPAISLPDVPLCTKGEAEVGQLAKLLHQGTISQASAGEEGYVFVCFKSVSTADTLLKAFLYELGRGGFASWNRRCCVSTVTAPC